MRKPLGLLLLLLTTLSACGLAATPEDTPTQSATSTPDPPTATPTSSLTATPTYRPSPRPDETENYQIFAGIPYAEKEDSYRLLDVYRPYDEAFKSRPTLLVMNPGSADKGPLVRHFAWEGYLVIFVDTRMDPYPAPVVDAFCSLAWVYAHADEYGYDADNIVAIGQSMGGLIVSTMGTIDDPTPYLDGCVGELPETEWIKAVVSFEGIWDLAASDELGRSAIRFLHNLYMGVIPGGDPELWEEASPATWINGNEPPFLLVHGSADENVYPVHSIRFAEALREAGGSAEVVRIPNLAHGGTPTSAAGIEAVEEFLALLFGTP